MRVIQIYNQQRSISGGEENVVLQTTKWLREAGIWTELLMRSSRSIEGSITKKIKAAVTGIYNPEAYRYLYDYIAKHRPSVIHAHNLFPQWSPAILLACRDAKVPAIITVHCPLLTCPNWYHLYKNKICEKCLESGEHWCVLKNCRGNYVESLVYAFRSFAVRKCRWFHNAVTRIITPSEFLRQKLISSGFSAKQIQTIWNAVEIPKQAADPRNGKYVAFAGRLSQEKGVDTLLEVARMLPKVPFLVAGTGPMENKWCQEAPQNVTLVGFLKKDELAQFYLRARILVVPSVWYETFPITGTEGMAFGLPVVASRIGGLPELVRHNITGHLVSPGDIVGWSNTIRQLWSDPSRCHEMGLAGREWVKTHLTKDIYISKLIAAYRDAQDILTDKSKSIQE